MQNELKVIVAECDHLSPKVKWETIKSRLKSHCMQESRKIAANDNVAIAQLSEYVTEKENNIECMSEADLALLQKSKIDLEELQFKHITGVMFRSKAKWYMEAEQNSKYFFQLEKNRSNSKTCASLFNSEGKLITEQTEILNQQRKYYQDLYTSDEQIQFELEDIISKKIQTDNIAAQEELFSEDEVKEAIKGLRNGSCPGSDGFPIEMYKVCWSQIRGPLMDCIHDIYASTSLHKTARTGVLNLIPKGNKDTRYLKNMRPITLLNADYKIIEKCIANRMVPALCEVIHPDQTGFLPGRRITRNIRKILDLIVSASSDEEHEYLIINCDYMKCFDMIQPESVIQAMEIL